MRVAVHAFVFIHAYENIPILCSYLYLSRNSYKDMNNDSYDGQNLTVPTPIPRNSYRKIQLSPDGSADGKASVSGLSSAAGASCRKGDG